MKEIRIRIRILTIILVLMLATLVAYTAYNVAVYGNRWLANGRNVRIKKDDVIAGKIYDRNNVLLRSSDASGKRIGLGGEQLQKALVHVLGDDEGRVANAVESFQASYLYGFNTDFGEKAKSFISGEKTRGEDITLTIDSALQEHAVKAFTTLPGSQGKNGAIVVMNYRTGEVLTLASLPNFDPFNVSESDANDPNKTFFNRATQSLLPPGSIFKIITMAAAIDNDRAVLTRNFICSGKLNVGNNYINDAGGAVHVNLGINKALEQSCNSVFAGLSLELGSNKLRKMAENFGFNDNFLFRDLVLENSRFPNEKLSDFDLASAGIGQSKILVSPLHMCMMVSAIANDGVIMEPYLLKSVYNPSNGKTRLSQPNTYKLALDADICHNIDRAMLSVVNNGTGARARAAAMQIAGKTGTAQSELDGKPITYSWFVGYAKDKPYALCLLVEDGESGALAAAPIASQIFEFLAKQR
ncbi:MAG: penicillin-binding transpeptidase domain-containing protein [Eubacteriales bacterium]|nr:penicillin-binding transpeptidase domain-containing protein [Eubacteriales bacterium]